MRTGIYKITNNYDGPSKGKSYIGLAVDIDKRWSQHRNYEFKKEKDYKKLYFAFEEFGINNFSFEILELCSREQLAYLENKYIKLYDSYNRGYNCSWGGEGVLTSIANKYNLDIDYKVFDHIKYHDYSQEEKKLNHWISKVESHELKIVKKLNKYYKKEKWTQDKISIKSNKYRNHHLKKINRKKEFVNYWQSQKDAKISLNEKLKSRVERTEYLVNSEIDKIGWSEYYNDLYLYAIKYHRFQKNYVKYKKTYAQLYPGNVQIKSDRIIFIPTGAKNTTVFFKEFKSCEIYISNDYIIISINNHQKWLLSIHGKLMLSSQELLYNNGGVINFINFEDFREYLIYLRKKIMC